MDRVLPYCKIQNKDVFHKHAKYICITVFYRLWGTPLYKILNMLEKTTYLLSGALILYLYFTITLVGSPGR